MYVTKKGNQGRAGEKGRKATANSTPATRVKLGESEGKKNRKFKRGSKKLGKSGGGKVGNSKGTRRKDKAKTGGLGIC